MIDPTCRFSMRRLPVVNALPGATTAPGAFTPDNLELRAGAFDYEQRELLMPMHHLDRVIDIERQRVSASGGVHETDKLAQRRRILPTRDGGLRAQVLAGVG